MRASFYTLGCKVNQYDTQTMEALFASAGYDIVPFGSEADVTVVNTCTVTAMSDKKSRQTISRAHAASPTGATVVAGCYAQRDAKAVLALPGVFVALGNGHRGRVVELAERALFSGERIDASDDMRTAKRFEELPAATEGKTRATLKIQDGCNRYCSYCIIPYARGPVRSRSIDGIKKEVERLAVAGFREFVLTGIHLASYGTDSGHTLKDAIAAVSACDGVRRIRLGSLEPLVLTEDFCAFCADTEKLCRQFHVSLQSGSETVLSRMNRRYTPKEYEENVAVLRSHLQDAAVTTDVIAGFCGETEEEHEETKEFVRRVGFSRIHVFPFSKREGTKAASMPDMDKRVKEQRAKELIAIGEELSAAYVDASLGTVQSVLFEEECGDGAAKGYTGTYISVTAKGARPGEILDVRLKERTKEGALGTLV